MENGTPAGPPEAKRQLRLDIRQIAVPATVVFASLLSFLLLLDVLLNYDNPVVPWLVHLLGRGTWIAILLGLLALLLVLQIVLLRLSGKEVPPTLRAVAEEFIAIVQPSQSGAAVILLVGCPACGTAFEHSAGEGTFECPNCRRLGKLASDAPRRTGQVRTIPCRRCGNTFQAYRPGAECPVCHTPHAG